MKTKTHTHTLPSIGKSLSCARARARVKPVELFMAAVLAADAVVALCRSWKFLSLIPFISQLSLFFVRSFMCVRPCNERVSWLIFFLLSLEHTYIDITYNGVFTDKFGLFTSFHTHANSLTSQSVSEWMCELLATHIILSLLFLLLFCCSLVRSHITARYRYFMFSVLVVFSLAVAASLALHFSTAISSVAFNGDVFFLP